MNLEKKLNEYANSCLSYLTSDANELANFMNFAGYEPKTLRDALGSHSFSLALLEYFSQNEAALLAMGANANINAKEFMLFWQQLNQHE